MLLTPFIAGIFLKYDIHLDFFALSISPQKKEHKACMWKLSGKYPEVLQRKQRPIAQLLGDGQEL